MGSPIPSRTAAGLSSGGTRRTCPARDAVLKIAAQFRYRTSPVPQGPLFCGSWIPRPIPAPHRQARGPVPNLTSLGTRLGLVLFFFYILLQLQSAYLACKSAVVSAVSWMIVPKIDIHYQFTTSTGFEILSRTYYWFWVIKDLHFIHRFFIIIIIIITND